MNSFIKVLIIFISLSILFSMKKVEKDFDVYIEQKGKIIKSENEEVTLKKSAFDIVIEFTEPAGVLINASFNSQSYSFAHKGIPKNEISGFKNTGMAEHLSNPDNEILISFDAPSYWFFENEEKHRFNSVQYKKGKYICKRTIENFYDVDSGKNTIVEEVEDPLYLVFIMSEYNQDFTKENELKRKMIKRDLLTV